MSNLEMLACRHIEFHVEFVLCGGLAALLDGASILTRQVEAPCERKSL